jgi:transketolase
LADFFSSNSASAPAKQVYEKFGITGPNVAARVQKTVKHYKSLGHPVYSPVSTQINV